MRPVYGLGAFIPVALVLSLADAAPSLVFATSALGIVPMAALMGEATEQLAARSGPGIGGLVNVTFGNAPELIIAVFALSDGLQEAVKASLVGSIVGNSLLVLGAAMLAGAGIERARPSIGPPRRLRLGCCSSRSSRSRCLRYFNSRATAACPQGRRYATHSDPTSNISRSQWPLR